MQASVGQALEQSDGYGASQQDWPLWLREVKIV